MGGCIRFQVFGLKSPRPIIAGNPRYVHPGFAAQSQYILQREDRIFGRGGQGCPNKIPVDAGTVRIHIAADLVPGILGSLSIPADGGIIVMGACVAYTVADKIVGQVIVFSRVVEAKLEYPHTRESVMVAQCFHGRRDDPQVFGDNRQMFAQSLDDRVKKVRPGTSDPFPVDGGFFAVRNGPVSFETTEMIDTQHIIQPELVTDPPDPPPVTVLPMVLPKVEGIAPKLSRGAEIVRRHAGHNGGKAVFIQIKQLLVSPHIGAV